MTEKEEIEIQKQQSESEDASAEEEEDSYEEEEEEEESDEILIAENANSQARFAAATKAKNSVQVGSQNNFVASLSQSYIIANGSKHPWELINPAGVHPKDKKKSIFHYKLSVLPDTVEAKPWTKEGADITDWFNYGFTEKTWEEYREKMLSVYENQENNITIKCLSSEIRRTI